MSSTLALVPARHVIIDRPGGYDRLRVERFDPGKRRAGHVRIAVEAIGVNYADCVARMGLYASAARYVGWPLVPGFEVAGRVAETDPSSSLREGEPVVAVTRFGGNASVLDVPAHQAMPLPRTPGGVPSMASAAGLPTAYATAWYALFPLASVTRGQRLLVHSAAGGVGGAILGLDRRRPPHEPGARVGGQATALRCR